MLEVLTDSKDNLINHQDRIDILTCIKTPLSQNRLHLMTLDTFGLLTYQHSMLLHLLVYYSYVFTMCCVILFVNIHFCQHLQSSDI